MQLDSVRPAAESPCARTPYMFHLWNDGLLCHPTGIIFAVIRHDWAAKLPEECICPKCQAQVAARRS